MISWQILIINNENICSFYYVDWLFPLVTISYEYDKRLFIDENRSQKQPNITLTIVNTYIELSTPNPETPEGNTHTRRQDRTI